MAEPLQHAGLEGQRVGLLPRQKLIGVSGGVGHKQDVAVDGDARENDTAQVWRDVARVQDVGIHPQAAVLKLPSGDHGQFPRVEQRVHGGDVVADADGLHRFRQGAGDEQGNDGQFGVH